MVYIITIIIYTIPSKYSYCHGRLFAHRLATINCYLIPYFLVTPTDYGAVSTILMFAACETRQCVDVAIMDDKTLELTETFIVTLKWTPALENRITLNPVDGDIEILDNDGRKYDNFDFSNLEISLRMVQLLYSIGLCA